MDDAQTTDTARAVVAAMLAAAGVVPPADEVAEIAAALPVLHRRMARQYAVACGDAAPVIVRWPR
ncbi:MAG: hypothetical protein AB7W59_17255 [Acidimicrobiia bacterium]